MTGNPSAPRLSCSPPFVIWRDPAVYASFPSFVQTSEGILMSFRAAPREPHDFAAGPGHQQHLHPRASLALTRLRGDLTAEEVSLFPPDLFAADQDPNLTRLPDGAILMSSFSWRPKASHHDNHHAPGMFRETTSGMSSMFWGGFTARSEDEGRSWQPRVWLPDLPGYPQLVAGQRGWPGGRLRGQIVVTDDNRLLLGGYDRLGVDQPFTSFLHESRDMGRSWQLRGHLARDPSGKTGFVEPTLYKLGDGDVLALHRSFGAQDRLAVTRSSDQGRSWSMVELQDVVGHPYHVLTLSTEWALVLYARRGKESSVHARLMNRCSGSLSGDEITLQQGAETRDIGYPSGLVMADGRVLVGYYWVDAEGCRYIEGLVLTAG